MSRVSCQLALTGRLCSLSIAISHCAQVPSHTSKKNLQKKSEENEFRNLGKIKEIYKNLYTTAHHRIPWSSLLSLDSSGKPLHFNSFRQTTGNFLHLDVIPSKQLSAWKFFLANSLGVFKCHCVISRVKLVCAVVTTICKIYTSLCWCILYFVTENGVTITKVQSPLVFRTRTWGHPIIVVSL